jgi:hypothetical protein
MDPRRAQSGFSLSAGLLAQQTLLRCTQLPQQLNISCLEVRWPPSLSRLISGTRGDMSNVTTGSPHPIAKPVRAPTSFPRAAVVTVALAAALVGSLALKQFAWLVGPVFLAPVAFSIAVGVPTPVTVVALVLWGWVLGPLGAILSVPLTSLLKVLLIDSDPRARWATALVGSTREHRRRSQGAPKTPLVPPSAQRQR